MPEPWKKIKEETVFSGWRNIIRKTFELPTGKIAEYDTIGPKREIVCILALSKAGEVILTPQFRTGTEQIYLELPGGAVDENESPLEAATRELLEETGFKGTLTQIATTAHDGFNDAHRHHFVAKNCTEQATPIADPDNVQHETLLVSLDEFRKILREGKCTDIATGYLGLDFLKLL